MTDPRAALAEVLWPLIKATDSSEVDWTINQLAERGVLLVTEERLAAALSDTATGIYATAAQHAAALFISMLSVDELAALSAEVTE